MADPITQKFIEGVATNVAGNIFPAIFQKFEDVRSLERNSEILETDFSTVQDMLNNIRNQFEAQQKMLEEPLKKWLTKMEKALGEAEDLINRANQHRQRAWYQRCCCLLWNLNLPTQVRAWKVTYDALIQELRTVCSIHVSIPQLVSTAAPQTDLLLQIVPDSGFKGSAIRTAQDQLQIWLTDPHCQSRVIGVYGMGGVGKTSLLKVIYNTYKKQVSGIFHVVLWFTVSQNFQIKELQASIAKEVGLNLEETSNVEERKIRLYASLRKSNKKFLIVLDDFWSSIDLQEEVGVGFGGDNQSKIIISSRNKNIIARMGALEYSVGIHPLSTEEGWELFTSRAFTTGAVTGSNIEEGIAREIAMECKGLPLAINVVAAAMRSKKTNDEWSRALMMMKNADPAFPMTRETIDAELYQKLKWSYSDLPHPNLKICFLCCAVFPEDYHIPVKRLVEMWYAEGLITPKGTSNFMDIGRQYIDVLVSRGLVEHFELLNIPPVELGRAEYLTVHDVLRDTAIYIGQKEENWLFSAGPHLQSFPIEEETRDCKRISIFGSNARDLPMDFNCPNLVSLWLMVNERLSKVPEGFLLNLPCLRVLELSHCQTSSLPSSVGQLGQLEFLSLERCYYLNGLPDSICNLSRLQTLNLQWCRSLHSLPSGIGELKRLKNLKLKGCDSLVTIPDCIFQLTSLNTFCLPMQQSCTVRAEDLTNFANLVELRARINAEIEVGRLGPWSDMRFLELRYRHDDVDVGVAEDVLPESMKHMKKLEELRLFDYQGLSLPNCICDFRNLKVLSFYSCHQLGEFPAMEIGSADASFPALDQLTLNGLYKLESLAGPSNVCNERAMPNLQYLQIHHCRFGQTLLSSIGKLPNLTQVEIFHCSEWKEMDFGSGSFQMLTDLTLDRLPMLESIGGPSNIWKEGMLPNLQTLDIWACPLLRKFPLGIEKLCNLKTIRGTSVWWESIVWENDEMKTQLSHLFSSPH